MLRRAQLAIFSLILILVLVEFEVSQLAHTLDMTATSGLVAHLWLVNLVLIILFERHWINWWATSRWVSRLSSVVWMLLTIVGGALISEAVRSNPPLMGLVRVAVGTTSSMMASSTTSVFTALSRIVL